MIHNLPNFLTVFRIMSIPALVFAFQLPGVWSNWTALVVFVVAGATDYFDGMLARKLGATTDLGRMLDPIADKMLAAAAILMLLAIGSIPLVPALIVICREILVSGLREYLGNRKVKIPVSSLAKWKTATQFTALGMLLAGEAVIWPKGLFWSMSEIGTVLIWAAAALTVVTGYSYWKVAYGYIIAGEDRGLGR